MLGYVERSVNRMRTINLNQDDEITRHTLKVD